MKHGWYYYFEKKPTSCSLAFAIKEANEQGSKIVPSCSTDNDFARLFSQWLQSSCSRGTSPKQSHVSVTRALKFPKFCCDENGEVEEDMLAGFVQVCEVLEKCLHIKCCFKGHWKVLENFRISLKIHTFSLKSKLSREKFSFILNKKSRVTFISAQ